MAMRIDPFTFWILAGDDPITRLSSDQMIAHAQRAVVREFELETEPQLHLWLDASPVTGRRRGLAVFGDGHRFYTYQWRPGGTTETTASDHWPLSALEWPKAGRGSHPVGEGER